MGYVLLLYQRGGEKVQTPIKMKTRWKSDSFLHRSLVRPITKTDKNGNILMSKQPSFTVSLPPQHRTLLKSYNIICYVGTCNGKL